jgi:SPP1 gp7 family putative phage head morphogenesis protein
MKNDSYWENRAAWDMYHRMEDAEQTADLLAKVYRNSSMLLTHKAKDIFEKYMTKHGLSETQAWNLLNTMQDQTSLEELLNALRNKDSDKTKQELLRELEAPAYRVRIERLQDLLRQVDTVMQEVYQQEQLFDTSFFQNLCEDTYYHSIYSIQKRTGYGFSFSNISQKQISQVLSMNWSGSHYSQRIWKNTQELSETLKQELLVSLLTGRTDRETSEVIMNRCGAGAMQARRLVRTESCFLSGELTARSYEECGIEKYRYLATLDLRTSKICRELDGKIFSMKDRKAGKNYPPMHPWCRSTTISVIDEDELRNMKRRAYNPKTGRTETVPANMTYDQWYKKYVKGNAQAEAEEKSVQNAAADKKQYERYREILGKDAPKRFADFQEMKYNDSEKWRFTKLDYQRRNELLQHPELKLPNAENAMAADAKFEKYLFGGSHPEGLAKGDAFSSRLGYDAENWNSLKKQIIARAPQYPALSKGVNGYGKHMYEQKIILYGLKGTPANVVVGWSADDKSVTMASAYIKEVK